MKLELLYFVGATEPEDSGGESGPERGKVKAGKRFYFMRRGESQRVNPCFELERELASVS